MQLKLVRPLACSSRSRSSRSRRPRARRSSEFDTAHTLFYEAPTRTNMFVYTPSLTLTVEPVDALRVNGGWEADIVSGASVASKAGSAYQATHPAADVITTASVHDFRNVGTAASRSSTTTRASAAAVRVLGRRTTTSRTRST